VPKEDQLFQIEFLEIAPTPIPVDRIFFVYLKGEIPPPKKRDLEHLGEDLANATLSITMDAVYQDGTPAGARTYTVPLRTTSFGLAHLSIRNSTGVYTDHLTSGGTNDILTDYWIPGMFLRTGTWTFEVVASLRDGTCLFAMSLTQWLEGQL